MLPLVRGAVFGAGGGALGEGGGALGAGGRPLGVGGVMCTVGGIFESRFSDLGGTGGFCSGDGLLGIEGFGGGNSDDLGISKDVGEFGGDVEEKDERREDISSEFSKASWRF